MDVSKLVVIGEHICKWYVTAKDNTKKARSEFLGHTPLFDAADFADGIKDTDRYKSYQAELKAAYCQGKEDAFADIVSDFI